MPLESKWGWNDIIRQDSFPLQEVEGIRPLDAFIFIDRALAFWRFFREALRFRLLYLCPWWQDKDINGNIQQQISENTRGVSIGKVISDWVPFCSCDFKSSFLKFLSLLLTRYAFAKPPFVFHLASALCTLKKALRARKKKTSPLTAASSYGIFAPFNFPLNASLKPGLTYNLQSSWQFVHNLFLGLCCRYVQWRGGFGWASIAKATSLICAKPCKSERLHRLF